MFEVHLNFDAAQKVIEWLAGENFEIKLLRQNFEVFPKPEHQGKGFKKE